MHQRVVLKVTLKFILKQLLILLYDPFPSGFPTNTLYRTKILYTNLLSPVSATWPAHLIRFDFITRKIFGEQYRSLISSLCSFHLSPVTSALLGQNIPHNTLFPSTLSLRSSFNMNDQASHPYKTTGKLRILYIFKCLIANSKTKDSAPKSNKCLRYVKYYFYICCAFVGLEKK